nr:hypothetical protein [Tanacetum cinerariifolium]
MLTCRRTSQVHNHHQNSREAELVSDSHPVRANGALSYFPLGDKGPSSEGTHLNSTFITVEEGFKDFIVGLTKAELIIGTALFEGDTQFVSGTFLGVLAVKVETVIGGRSLVLGPGKGVKGCIPRSLSWRVSLGKGGERGFRLDQVLTFSLVLSKTHREGCRLRVASSHTGNHRKDDFTPLETIRRFLGIIRSESLSSLKGRPLSRRGRYVINKVLDNVVVEGIDKESCADEVLDLGDEMASYMSSSGGGFQLEDDFYDGYEA